MPKDYPRHYRVADQIQRDMASIVQRDLKDPRIPTLTTIASVEVSRDLSIATVFITCMQNNIDRAALVTLFSERAGFIRSLLGKRLRMRSVPELRFRYDDTEEKASHIDRIIQDAMDKSSSPPSSA